MAAFVVCDTAEDIYSVPENQRVMMLISFVLFLIVVECQ